ncbi:MAG: hypothetical protein GX803_03655 [Lentisphaerae bacterium]|jgi:hypothetical protein|nr:hypothetical protein [Lentisphaerota bacterium]
MRKDKIIYSINIEDVQNVAQQELGRKLVPSELKIVEDKIGDQIDWFEAIASVINYHIAQHETAQTT